MGFARYLDRLLLGAWVGAILCFGVAVAPALFQELTPELAGAVVRRVIPKLDVFGMGAAVFLLGATLWAKVERTRVRVGLLAGMLALAGTSFFVLRPRMATLREEAGGNISALAKEHPVRREFGRLHGISTLLMLGELLGGLVLLGLPLRRTGTLKSPLTEVARSVRA